MDPIRQIAAGEDVAWSKEYEHPKFGKLVFSVPGMPKNRDWLRHAVRQDELIGELGASRDPETGEMRPGDPDKTGQSTKTLAASIAGLQVIFEPVPVGEERTEDPEVPGHETIVKRFYDPLEDESTDITVQAWLEFCGWRMGLLNRAGELGKSSGEILGSESGESSLAPMDSPSMIPA